MWDYFRYARLVQHSKINWYNTLHYITLIKPSLKAQLVKNLPVIQEILVQFLHQEDPLEKG